MRSRSLLVSFPVVLLLSCGGEPPPEPAVPIVSQTGKTVVVAADLSAVPAPANLAGYAELVNPRAVMNTAGSWVGLPIPEPRGMARDLTGEDVSEALDFEKPMFAAWVLDASGGSSSPKSRMVMSVGLSADARSIFERKFKLTQKGANWVLGSKDAEKPAKPRGDEGDEEEDYRPSHPCALAPSYEPTTKLPGLRLVCGDKDESVAQLSAYLTRTATRRNFPADAHLEFHMDPVRPMMDQAKAMGAFIGMALGSKGVKHPAVTAMITGAYDDLIESALDLEGITLDAFAKPEGLSVSTSLYAKGKQGSLTRMLVGKGTANPMGALGRMPKDAHSAFAVSGFEPTALEGAIEDMHKAIQEIVADNKDEKGKPIPYLTPDFAKNANAIVDSMRYLSAGSIVAHGVDPDEDKKPASGKAAAPSELPVFGRGWAVGRSEIPFATFTPMIDRWRALLSPAVTKALGEKLPNKLTISVSKTKPAPAALPKGSTEFDLSFTVTPPRKIKETSVSKAGKYTTTYEPQLPPVTTRVHYLAVPDGNGTLIAYGANEALVVKKLAATVSGVPGDTLATRPGLEALKGADGGGFITVKSVGDIVKGLESARRSPQKSIAVEGDTPVTFVTHLDAAGAGGTSKLDIMVPKKAMTEAMTVYLTAKSNRD